MSPSRACAAAAPFPRTRPVSSCPASGSLLARLRGVATSVTRASAAASRFAASPVRNAALPALLVLTGFLPTVPPFLSPSRAQEGSPGAGSAGQFSPQFLPKLEVPFVDAPIRIDGDLDEPGWRQAARARGFAEVNPGDQIRPPVDSEAWVAYDRANFYLALIARDDPGTVRAGLRERDQIWMDDYFGVMLDTYGDHAWGYEFFVNPLGIQGDLRIDTNGEDNPSPDYIWHSMGRVTEDGWQVEIAIPFSSLRFPDREEQVWRANFWRDHRRDVRRQIAWAATDRDNPCWMCQWGTLTGIRGVRPSRDLSVVASVIGYRDGRLVESHDAGPDRPAEGLRFEDPHGEAGLNLRYAVTSTSTAEATINPDFSQIESDASRIDVNEPYALFYDERRPFFQEGNELYRMPITAVYTRSIQDPAVAGKLLGTFGRTAVAWTAARDDDAPILFPLEERSFIRPGGEAWSNLLRVRRALGEDSYLGLVATDRRHDGSGGSTLAGLDGAFRFRQNLRLQFHAAGSRTEEPDDSLRARGLEGITFGRGGRRHTLALDGESFDGAAAYASLGYGSRVVHVGVEGSSYAPGFRADQGFVTRTDTQTLNAWGELNFRPNGRRIVSWTPQLAVGRMWDHAGRFQDEWLTPEISWSMRRQTAFSVEGMWSRERFREKMMPGIRRFTFEVESRPLEVLSASAKLDLMRTIYRTFDSDLRPFTGRGVRLAASASIWIGSRLQLGPELSYERLRQPAGPASPGRLLYDGWILRDRLDFQFSRATSLRLVTEYDKFDRSLRIEPLLTYRLNALSMVYFGIADRYDQIRLERFLGWGGAVEPPEEPPTVRRDWRLTGTQIFAKVQYLFRV